MRKLITLVAAALVRPSMPVFGGPTTQQDVSLGATLCHYGNGVVVGETFLTMARFGVGGGTTPTYWMADLIAAPGDSGSAVVTCVVDGTELRGQGPPVCRRISAWKSA